MNLMGVPSMGLRPFASHLDRDEGHGHELCTLAPVITGSIDPKNKKITIS